MHRIHDKIEADMPNILPVKPYRRKIKCYCGPATLKMVFQFFGFLVSEEEIAKVASTTNEEGTTVRGMIRAAKHFGFNAFSKRNCTPNDIRRYLNKKIPVIVDWFWEDDGHYGVVVGMDEKNIILRDPSFWKIKVKSLEMFDNRLWFDFPGNRIEKDRMIMRLMIVVTPKK